MGNAGASATSTVRVYSCQSATKLSRKSLRLSDHRVTGLLPTGMLQSLCRMRSLQSPIQHHDVATKPSGMPLSIYVHLCILDL